MERKSPFRAFIVAIALVLSMVIVFPGSARAAFPGSNGLIAFEDDGKIYTVAASGGEPDAIEGPVYVGADPTWSPDGSRIAFVGQGAGNADIFVMHADGSHIRRLTRGSSSTNPAWAPDGSRIVYTRKDNSASFVNPGNDGEIAVMNADGSNKRRLTNNAWGDEDPAWSPDGAQIVFATRDNPDLGPNTHNDAIVTMETDGDAQTIFQKHGGPDEFPVWSPDGLQIAWEGGSDILVKGAGTDNVVDDETIPSLTGTHSDSLDGFQPAWSPDGSKVLFVGRRPTQSATYELHYVDSDDGGNETAVTQDQQLSAASGAPDWQPHPQCDQNGGSGAQTLTGTAGRDVLCGGTGDDILKGRGGADILIGGGGGDTLIGASGNDILRGDQGIDVADYSSASGPIKASLKKEFATGDGSDVLVLVEDLVGSPAADILSGGSGANRVEGKGGNDELNVRDRIKGNDTVDGGRGASDSCRKDRRDTALRCP